MPGIMTSEITARGDCAWNSSMASTPSFASSGWNPSISSSRAIMRRTGS